MTVIKGAMNAGITSMGAVTMGGVGGIVVMTGSMTTAVVVVRMGVVENQVPSTHGHAAHQLAGSLAVGGVQRDVLARRQAGLCGQRLAHAHMARPGVHQKSHGLSVDLALHMKMPVALARNHQIARAECIRLEAVLARLFDTVKHQVKHPGHSQPHCGDGEGTEAGGFLDRRLAHALTRSARPKPLAQQTSGQQGECACHHTSRCIEPLHGFSMSFNVAFS